MTSARYLAALVFALSILSITCIAHATIDPNLAISPDPLVFDDVPPGGTSGPETLRLTNTATSGSSIAINNVDVTDDVNFSVTSDGCSGKTLSPNTYCDVSASFTPTQGSGGYFSGFVVFGTESQSDPIGASVLRGQAVAPIVDLSATSIAFGNQTVGNASIPHEISLENSGNGTLTITSITTSAPFSVADNCGATLAPGVQCTIGTTFTPTVEGAASGSVSIVTDAASSPDTISLGGTGVAAGQPDVSLSTGSLDFGGQLVNTTSAAQNVTLKNTGTVNLAITSITPPANFASTDDCGAVQPAGGTCTIDITFTPDAVQAYSGNLSIVTDAPDSPHSVALQGFGAATDGPKSTLSQTSIDFGEQKLRTTSNPQSTTITNEGNQDLVVQSIEKTADASGSYSGDEDCVGKSIGPGQTCTINVVFNPQEKGTLAATASIADNSAASPQTLVASGIGVRISGGSCSLTGAPTPSAFMLMIFGIIPAYIAGGKRD